MGERHSGGLGDSACHNNIKGASRSLAIQGNSCTEYRLHLKVLSVTSRQPLTMPTSAESLLQLGSFLRTSTANERYDRNNTDDTLGFIHNHNNYVCSLRNTNPPCYTSSYDTLISSCFSEHSNISWWNTIFDFIILSKTY